jgi:aminoglycoside phosphotransferase
MPPVVNQWWTSVSALSKQFWSVFEAVFLREVPWLQRIAPRILRPGFTWPHRRLGDRPLASRITPCPPLASGFWLRIIGCFHAFLQDFSRYYCAWFGFPHNYAMSALPFGLLLKWSDGTTLDEVNATRAVRAAGIPAPKIITYGVHPDKPWAPVSILMTRLPGLELGDMQDFLDPEEKETIERELGVILQTMRAWPNPWGKNRICSISGGAIRSLRVPNHAVGPYDSEEEFTAYLLSAASSHSFKTKEEYEQTLAIGRKMEELKHRIVFSHGDFYMHNILVHDGHVSGLIDWETAGWYPEYWEFTTPLRWASLLPEWREMLLRLGGDKYGKELEAEQAIRKLTVDSWIW